MKKGKILAAVTLMVLMVMALSACGKSEFGASENTEKLMTITAQNAQKDAFFMTGSLEVSEGEQIVISSDLSKGSVKVELIREEDEQSIDELPDLNGEPVVTANVSGSDMQASTVPEGSYMLNATCTEKATGTVKVEVKPAE